MSLSLIKENSLKTNTTIINETSLSVSRKTCLERQYFCHLIVSVSQGRTFLESIVLKCVRGGLTLSHKPLAGRQRQGIWPFPSCHGSIRWILSFGYSLCFFFEYLMIFLKDGRLFGLGYERFGWYDGFCFAAGEFHRRVLQQLVGILVRRYRLE